MINYMDEQKNPKNNKKNIIILFVVLDIIIIALAIFFGLKYWKSNQSTEYNQTVAADQAAEGLKDIQDRCKNTDEDLMNNCIASYFKSYGYLSQAEEFCNKIKIEKYPYLKIMCIASIVANKNLDDAKNMCNGIDDSFSKNICIARILPFNDTVNFCGLMNETDQKYYCEAILNVRFRNSDVTSLSICENIQNNSIKILCINSVKPFQIK
jgi:hypothetical protein